MGQQFRKVRGRTLEEAYQSLRRSYGPEALVVNTQTVREGGVLGFLGKKLVEVTVAVPAPGPTSPRRSRSAAERKYAAQSHVVKDPEMNADVKRYEELIRDAQRRMNMPPAAPPPQAPREASGGASPMLAFPQQKRAPEAEDAGLGREVREIREMMQVLYAEHPGAGLPTEFAPHYRTLVERGVARKVAAALIGAVVQNSDMSILRDQRVFVERLHFEVRRIVEVTGGIALQPGTRRVVALCGATGVGKTTNLAKLAAQFSIHEHARVGLLTADTYRVAASDQLRVYANIIGLPMHIANDAREAAEALRAFRDCDLVLVDTAGGSHFNLAQINELKGILHALGPHETILVLGAGTQHDDLRNMVSNFKCLGPTSILFTKLDETRQYGAMLSMLVEAGLPLSYFSSGQNVPDDIRVATGREVANLVLEGNTDHG